MQKTVKLALLCFSIFAGFHAFHVRAEPSGNSRDSSWLPEHVPVDDWDGFFFYYQRFLQENPFDSSRNPGKTEQEKNEKRENDCQLALLYEKLSVEFDSFARSEQFPAAAPEDVTKEKSKKIAGSWNLYQNVPPNSTDLWQEACYLKYKSLLHESVSDANRPLRLHRYVDQLEQYEPLSSLYQSLKRDACLKSLRAIRKAIENKKGKNADSDAPPPSDESLDRALGFALEHYARFLKKYPTEENFPLAELFLDTVDRFRSRPGDFLTNLSDDAVELLRRTFVEIRNKTSDSVVEEYAALFEGVLRRQELLGRPMPIWGVDLNGSPIEKVSLDGKIVLLDFWATWCGPCVAEFPRLKKLYAKYHSQGFEIIGYSVDSDLEKLYAYLKRNPLPWIVLSKESTRTHGLPSLSTYYGAKRLPVVLLRNRDGNAVLLDARGDRLEEILEKLFQE